MLFKERLVTGFVGLLEIILKRTARRHKLQEAATRMIVLQVGLEMIREAVDALRQDRDVNIRGIGLAELGGGLAHDFLFALRGSWLRQTVALRAQLAVSTV